MKYKRFEDVPVWRDAVELAVLIFELTSQPAFKGYYSVKDQLERAGVSISNNIAEGFERHDSGNADISLHLERIERRGPLLNIFAGAPANIRLSAISDLKSEISRCKHLATTPRLVRIIAEYGYQGTAVFDR